MRIHKFIDISQEIEIELSSEDICLILEEDPESVVTILRNLNSVATFLKGIPASRIIEMTKEQRAAVRMLLWMESNRYIEKED